MSQDAIKRASELINSKTADKTDIGFGGYAALSTIDENGYPSASTFSISRADGINWITFATGKEGRPYAERISKNNKACACINSETYTINLVGTVEALTDIETKKANWNPAWTAHWSGPDDPQMLVLRFRTERYTIFFVDDGGYAAGEM